MTETESRPARRTGRPPLTDRATLLAAARELGFSDLTVGAVTARVGVKYSTFYRHFPSLEALQAALANELLPRDAFPTLGGGRWQEELLAVTAATFDVMAAHPGMAGVLVRLPEVPETLMTVYRELIDSLLAAGFSAEDAVLAAGSALHTGLGPWLTAAPGRGAGDLHRAPQIVDSMQPFAPQVRAVFRDQVDDPPRSWTLRRVEILIAGLESRLAS
ncbi:TetR/AcrR family transcriptional regulator [Pseudonocardia phyllosphaerae]|uniref:TetR/AcrR family transcriptional regulator n=1 Tax=Pseudonocardia phyllosphaerae TaxID=3390502 RepID=UPI00397C662B